MIQRVGVGVVRNKRFLLLLVIAVVLAVIAVLYFSGQPLPEPPFGE